MVTDSPHGRLADLVGRPVGGEDDVSSFSKEVLVRLAKQEVAGHGAAVEAERTALRDGDRQGDRRVGFGEELVSRQAYGSRERAPRRRNWLRFTRLLSGVSSKPITATDFPSHPRLSRVSIAPMPNVDVESFLARSVLISSDCLNQFLAATGILGPAADVARYHYNHVNKAQSKSKIMWGSGGEYQQYGGYSHCLYCLRGMPRISALSSYKSKDDRSATFAILRHLTRRPK
jgi:hypothetical protein